MQQSDSGLSCSLDDLQMFAKWQLNAVYWTGGGEGGKCGELLTNPFFSSTQRRATSCEYVTWPDHFAGEPAQRHRDMSLYNEGSQLDDLIYSLGGSACSKMPDWLFLAMRQQRLMYYSYPAAERNWDFNENYHSFDSLMNQGTCTNALLLKKLGFWCENIIVTFPFWQDNELRQG